MRCLMVWLGVTVSSPVWAAGLTENQEGYVASNTIGIFYHELGHALIDILGVRFSGKEEDTADTVSVLMVDYGYDEQSAEQIADDIAATFAIDSETSRSFFWDAHSSDSKRSENTVCMFYGGNPKEREAFAEVWDLPQQKRDICIKQRERADDLWSEVLDEVDSGNRSNTLNFTGNQGQTSAAAAIGMQAVKDEVFHLNSWMKLPRPLSVRIDICDEANAFYDPEHTEIVMCTEFSDYLAKQVE